MNFIGIIYTKRLINSSKKSALNYLRYHPFAGLWFRKSDKLILSLSKAPAVLKSPPFNMPDTRKRMLSYIEYQNFSTEFRTTSDEFLRHCGISVNSWCATALVSNWDCSYSRWGIWGRVFGHVGLILDQRKCRTSSQFNAMLMQSLFYIKILEHVRKSV